MIDQSFNNHRILTRKQIEKFDSIEIVSMPVSAATTIGFPLPSESQEKRLLCTGSGIVAAAIGL